jgi:hypothetical protein
MDLYVKTHGIKGKLMFTFWVITSISVFVLGYNLY